MLKALKSASERSSCARVASVGASVSSCARRDASVCTTRVCTRDESSAPASRADDPFSLGTATRTYWEFEYIGTSMSEMINTVIYN